MKFFTVVLDQRGRRGLVEAGRLIGSGVPGVGPVSVTGSAFLTPRQSSVDGNGLAGCGRGVRRAAVLSRRDAENQRISALSI